MAAVPASGGGFFDGMAQAVDKLVAAANTGGGFGVSDSGGQALIGAIDTYLTELEQQIQDANTLGQELPLGSSPAATTYKPFIATVATDQAQGFIPAAKNFKQRLVDAKAAIQKSMASYQQTEQQNTSAFKPEH